MQKPDTQRRLWDSFAAESAAHLKYTFYAAAARKEGFQQIAAIFDETAGNEREHAKLWLKALNALPDGSQPGDTLKNLQSAADGERLEWVTQYKECAKAARQEGENILAERFEQVAAIEAAHEQRYRALAQNLETGAVFSRPQTPAVTWRCRNCGHLHTGPDAPDVCPVCAHPQAYFELQEQNY